MKTSRPFALLAVAGALLTPPALLHAQQSLRVGTDGHPTASLNLGDAHVTGTLDAARLPLDAAFRTLNITAQTLFTGPVSLPANQPITLSGSDISNSVLTVGAGGICTPLALPANQSFRRNAANTAFEAYAPNAGDGSALTNLNAAAIGSGTVPPARLGNGTPSSTTVLRGDGSWAGLTATGNTVAATGNLLMGDGAGNAAAVGNSADFFRVLKARADTQTVTFSVASPNILPACVLHLGTSVQNPDATITIAANSFVYWDGDPNQTANLSHYGYVVTAGDVPAGALSPGGWYGGFGNVDQGNTRAQPDPGVFTTAFTNHVGVGGYQFGVQNNTAAPVTIYYPYLGLTDPGHPVFASYTDATAAPAQPIADLDFTRFVSADRSGRYLAEKQTTVAADSVTGASGNAGTLYAPKLSLAQTLSAGSVFGLYRGSLFRDSLPLASAGGTRGIVVQDLGFGSLKTLPIVSGLDPAANGSFTSNGDGTYSYLWTPAEAIVNDGYSNVYAVEINTATEAATPLASRHRLTDVSAAAGVAGTVWIQGPGTGAGQSGSATQWKAVIHPSDGLAPGSGTYRYEVVSRVGPAAYPALSTTDAAMSGVELVGGSNGYGSLSGPTGFVGDRLVLVHATTHNAVIGGGSLQRSVFYEAGDTVAPGPSIQLAWYTGVPTGLRWDTRQCLFYANVGDRPANCLISHSSGTNYDRGDISDCAFLGARWSDGSLHGTAIDYVNVNTGVIDRVYVQGINDAFGLGMPLSAEVRHSVFRQVNRARVGVNFHDNVVLAESGSDAANANHRYPIACYFQQTGASATNNLFWARGIASGVQNDDQAYGITFDNSSLSGCTFQHNVIVLNPASTTQAPCYFTLGSATLAGLNVDYNLVINLAKGGFNANKPGTNYTTWSAYQAGLALDLHSLYVDVSSDPRGIQAVFVDPINGDFRWAQTDVGRRCAAYCVANHVGPATITSRWPLVPTVDDAVRLLTDL